MERRLAAAAEFERNGRAGDEALLQRLKRDLKRTKALLRDTQAQLERQKSETPGMKWILYENFHLKFSISNSFVENIEKSVVNNIKCYIS